MTFDNFDGVVNWAFLLLIIGGVRLALENFNKKVSLIRQSFIPKVNFFPTLLYRYGIRVDLLSWILYLPEAGTRTTICSILCKLHIPRDPSSTIIVTFITVLNVHVLVALIIEKLDVKGWISRLKL